MTDKQTVKFGDIAEQIMIRISPTIDDAKTFIGLEHLQPGHFYVHNWGSEIELKTQAFKVSTGDVIFSRRNTYLKRVSVSPIDGICSADAMVIRPKRNPFVIDGYLPHLMQSSVFMDLVIANSAGSLSSRVKWNELEKLSIDIPNVDQQAATLDTLNSLAKKELLHIENSQAIEKLLYSLGLRVFDNYFDPRIEKRIQLPAGWGSVPMRDVLLSQPVSGYSPVETPKETGKYVLNLNCLSKVGFRQTVLKNITVEHFSKGCICKNGDLFISRSNTADLVGLVGKYNPTEGNGKTIFPDTMWRLDVDEDVVKKDFLMFYLMSPYGRKAVQSIAAGTSGSMKKINKEGFSKIKVPVPPFEIQKLIVNTFRDVYESKWNHEQSQNSLMKLRQAVIDRDI